MPNLVKEQFQGTCAYVTTCHACGQRSVNTAPFYELELNTTGVCVCVCVCVCAFSV